VEVFLLSLSSGCGGYTENESMPDSFNCAGVSTCRLAHLQARFEETAYDAATQAIQPILANVRYALS
jgi:hypothetical protein